MRAGWLAAIAIAVGLGACAQPPASLGDPQLDAGRDVYRRVCAACHGGNGEGESGPALAEVLATFPDCSGQKMWITLGSSQWKEEVAPTLPGGDREITRVMPSFQSVLTPEEIAQVAAYERFSFGGSPADEALTDCELS